MIKSNIDWTHKNICITDVRKLNKLYVIKIDDPKRALHINSPLFVKDIIFEERLKSYFLKDIQHISREEILGVKWNMYITLGYYIKINENGDIQKFNIDADKWYVSYLEIGGALAAFSSIYKDYKEKHIKDTII